MKKIILLFVICLVLLPCVYGAEEDFSGKEKKFFPVKDRIFEIGFGAGGNVSNNLLSIGEIFSETLLLDLDKLSQGVFADFGTFVPFFINLNFGTWGIGLYTGVDVTGGLGLNGNMLTFKEASNEKSDFNAAVFAFAGIDSFFHIQHFKVKFKPAVFYPMAYIVQDNFSYTFNSPGGMTQMIIGYDFLFYTAAPMDGFDVSKMLKLSNMTTSPGFDFSLGVEYPISEVTGLNKRAKVLDFDIGMDLVNIPIVASVMNDYNRMFGGLEIIQGEDDELKDLLDKFNNFNSNTQTGSKKMSVDRAFKMFFWADWRPLNGNPLFAVTPVIGFALNDLYNQPFSMELGVKARVNIQNMFIATAGINYEDRLYKNSLGLTFNCRAMQLDIGAELQSADFIGSWTAKGVGANVGIRFGW